MWNLNFSHIKGVSKKYSSSIIKIGIIVKARIIRSNQSGSNIVVYIIIKYIQEVFYSPKSSFSNCSFAACHSCSA